MTYQTKKQVVWGIRILVSALFILSAVAKLYPSPLMGITGFESKYLSSVGIEGGLAKVVSRMLIGFEFTLAILLLLPYYLKKVIFPTTIGLLGVFSIHLFVQVIQGDASNCGCFGELIPMTPLEALIKNILTIGLLLIPLTLFKNQLNERKNKNPVLYTGLVISLLMFMALPQGSSHVSGENLKVGDSIYSQYYPEISKGNKLLCFFSPTCDHCIATGKELVKLKKKYPGLIPELKIIFMDESWPIDGSPLLIKDFFNTIGAKFDYVSIEPSAFWTVFESHQKGMNVPGVFYLQDGVHKALYSGSSENNAENPFNTDALIKEIKREY